MYDLVLVLYCLQAVVSSSLPTIAAKKNRIEEPARTSSTESVPSLADDPAGTENNTSVDETRKEVEKLSHEEKARGLSSKLLTVEEEDRKDDAASVDPEGSIHEPEAETGQKRKMLARAESANIVHEESVKRVKEDDVEVSSILQVFKPGRPRSDRSLYLSRSRLIPLQRLTWKHR